MTAHITLSTVQAVIGILLGSGAIAAGLWRIGSAIYKRARRAEQLRDTIVDGLLDHEDRIRVLEGVAPRPPASATGGANIHD